MGQSLFLGFAVDTRNYAAARMAKVIRLYLDGPTVTRMSQSIREGLRVSSSS